MMKDIESLTWVLSELREGSVNPEDLVEKLLKRIKRLDGKVNSYTTINKSAMKEARSATARGGKFKKTIDGIPVSIKDNIDTRGVRTTYGSPIFAHNVPHENADVVNALLTSGAILLGKTNSHEFGLGIETPPTKNPWDTARIPGGSSGGSAAAIAANLAMFCLGTDSGGSIRIPASMCGVTGLKPSWGKVSTKGAFPDSWSLNHIGPICRFAKDVPLMLKAMGYQTPPFKHRRLSAGLITDFFEKSKPKIRSICLSAVDRMVSERLIEVDDFRSNVLPQSLPCRDAIDQPEIATVHHNLYGKERARYLETSGQLIRSGAAILATSYIEACQRRDTLIDEFARETAKFDVLISPTLPDIAPTIADVHAYAISHYDPWISFVGPFNLLKNPAISIPCGFDRGLPVGLQIISGLGRDDLVIGLASEYQESSDWHLESPGWATP